MNRQRTKNEPIYRQVRKNYQSKDNPSRTYVYWMVDYVEKGNREKKQWKVVEKAKTLVEKFTEARDRIGERFFDMTHAEIDSTSPPPESGLEVSEVVEAYLEEARQEGLRPMSITHLTNKLGRFTAAFGKRPIREFTGP